MSDDETTEPAAATIDGGREARPMLADQRAILDPQPARMTATPNTMEAVQQAEANQSELAEQMEQRKEIVLGGVVYPAISAIPALVLKDIMSMQAAAKGDDQSAALEMAFLFLDSVVEDEFLPTLHQALRSKSNPVPFMDVIEEVGRKLPLFLGHDLGKASG